MTSGVSLTKRRDTNQEKENSDKSYFKDGADPSWNGINLVIIYILCHFEGNYSMEV